MRNKRKLSFFSVFYPFIQGFLSLITPLLLLLIFKSSNSDYLINEKLATILLITVGVLLILVGLFRWISTSYELNKNELFIHKGIIFKSIEKINKDKIQNYSITKLLPFDKAPVILSLQLEGEDVDSSITLKGILNKDAHKIIRILYVPNKQSKNLVENNTSWKQIILSILDRSLVVTIVVTFFSTFSQIPSIDVRSFRDYIYLSYWLDLYVGMPVQTYIYGVVLTILSLLKQCIKIANFKLRINDSIIEISTGLFSEKNHYISRENISGIMIEQSIFQKLSNCATVYVETVEKDQKKVLFHPYMSMKKISKLTKQFYIGILPKNAGEKQGAFLNQVLVSIILSSILCFLLYLFDFLSIITTGFVYVTMIMYLLKYYNVNYTWNEEFFIYRNGLIKKKIFIFEKKYYNNIQFKKYFWMKKRYHLSIGYFNNSYKKNIKLKNINKESLIKHFFIDF
ncbi:PH domain-containing protein [Massilibacterium senegalense]|uniref:PH domain-containing protein n=1 Tax=Massilibacterium senegalense TaxID=1632858 RepID=UPI0007843BF8|nr:PH domain-containing protein [Massilibacterium senegalense]